MDKRQLANRRVKDKIERALMQLMSEKSFSEITVSDIICRSGVARASYYRNYYSKEEILLEATDNAKNSYHARLEKIGCEYNSYEGILLAFRYFKAYRKYILCVYNAGLSTIYLKLLDEYLETEGGDMKNTDIRRYMLYFYSGAIYNVFMKWLENEMQETPEEMARLLFTIIRKTK